MKTHQLAAGQIDELLAKAQVGHLATIDQDGSPYVVPVHFVHVGDRIFIHGLIRGHKLDNIAREPKVGFEVTGDFDLIHGPSSCQTNTAYQSVVIRGLASVVEDEEDVLKALEAIAFKYTPQHAGGAFLDEALVITAVIAVEIRQITGKYYS